MITMKLIGGLDQRGRIFLAVIALAAVMVPSVALMLPETSPVDVRSNTASLVGKSLCFHQIGRGPCGQRG